MNKKILFFFFCCFLILSKISLAAQRPYDDQIWKVGRQNPVPSFLKKMREKENFHELKYNLKIIKSPNKIFHFSHKINVYDFRYQMFIGLFLFGMVQANLDMGNVATKPHDRDEYEKSSSSGQLMCDGGTCPNFQNYAPSCQFLQVPLESWACFPEISQQQSSNMLSNHNKPLEKLFSETKSLVIQDRKKTYNKIYPNYLTKAQQKKIYESFRSFLPIIKEKLDQSIAEGKKVGLIFGERHKAQECDLFNQLVVRFVKMYLDPKVFYSEGNKEIIDLLNNEAKAWKTRNRPFKPIKDNDGKAWGVGKIVYFEEIGMPVEHTEASNIGSDYMSYEAQGLFQAGLCLLD